MAISSLFLNSPLTKTTLPFSSNSVQRSFCSFAAFADIVRPRAYAVASAPSSPYGPSTPLRGRRRFTFLPNARLSQSALWLSDAHLYPPIECFALRLMTLARGRGELILGRIAGGSVTRGMRKSRLRRLASQVAGVGMGAHRCEYDGFGAPSLFAVCCCGPGGDPRSKLKPCEFALKKQRPSDWNWRNLNKLDEGTGTGRLARMADMTTQ